MKKNKHFFIIVIFFVIGLFLINLPSKNLKQENNNYVIDYVIKYVKIAGQKIKVDLALTPETREQGLSGRKGLLEGEGMLFVFPNLGQYNFWMKDMNFPIDIIWLAPLELGGDDSKAKVIYIKKDARPELYPENYGPDSDTKYVLEVVSGFSEKNNLKVGDWVEFLY